VTTKRRATDRDEGSGIPQEGLFRLEGEYWTIEYDGRLIRIRDNKGLRYMSRLLSDPGRLFPAADLGGPTERSPAALERARLNVTRAIHATRARIALLHPGRGTSSRTSGLRYSCMRAARMAALLSMVASRGNWAPAS